MKSCTWQAPLVVRRFKSPTGPLADADPGMCYDFSKQRAMIPHPVGAGDLGRGKGDPVGHTMNSGGSAAQADLTSLDTNGTGSPFLFPK